VSTWQSSAHSLLRTNGLNVELSWSTLNSPGCYQIDYYFLEKTMAKNEVQSAAVTEWHKVAELNELSEDRIMTVAAGVRTR